MKARLLVQLDGDHTTERPDGIYPAGTIIDHPDAYRLVRLGAAAPADEECMEKAAMSDSQQKKAQYHYLRMERGILPEHAEAYAQGVFVGYDPDGTPIDQDGNPVELEQGDDDE